MARRNILLRLAYDGSDFNGYQIQAQGERTVQGVLERALERVHGHPVSTVAAGRTDAGVHADAQFVSFFSDLPGVPEERFALALNRHLPADLKVQESRVVPESFHARYSATFRGYRYYLLPAPVPIPKHRRFSWRISEKPDLRRLNRDAEALVGEHDFTTFAAVGQKVEHNIRVVHHARFTEEPPFVVFSIRANGFLWKMVRSMVGTMVDREIGRRRHEPPVDSMETVLLRQDRDAAGTTAPPQGLFLTEVGYDG